jgi:hypothetical protein
MSSANDRAVKLDVTLSDQSKVSCQTSNTHAFQDRVPLNKVRVRETSKERLDCKRFDGPTNLSDQLAHRIGRLSCNFESNIGSPLKDPFMEQLLQSGSHGRSADSKLFAQMDFV